MVRRLAPAVPATAPRELRRERLLELLHRHRSRPLIVMAAPAGFGKSTLAATYARDSGAAVVWLTLQAADRDSRRMFARLADALECAFDEPHPVPELRRALASGAEGAGLARELLADLDNAPAGFIVVLDDFHVVDDLDEVVEAIDVLVRELPETGQIVITGRKPPALSMTRLVVSDAVFALGTEDLRFTEDETRALRAAIGGDASRDEQAEGWVAGILLGGAPRQLGVGSGSLLSGYVEREILSRLKPIEQRWLESLAVVDIITPKAAERLLGRGPWIPRLLPLTEQCPFLVPGEDGSFRLHGLVRETLLNRLRRAGGTRATRAWTAARELAKEAFDTVAVVHACEELGQLEDAIEVVLRTASEAMQTGRWPTLLMTVELLSEAVRRADPELSLMEARARFNTGHAEQARDAAEAALQHGGRTGDVSVQVSAIVELATIAIFSGENNAADDWLSAADHILARAELSLDRKRVLEGRVLSMRAVSAATRGDTEAAHDAFSTAERLLSLVGPSRDLAVVQQNFGVFCSRIGDYAAAQTALTSAAAHWRLMGDRNGLALTQVGLGDIHLRIGVLEPAGMELADARDAARSVGSRRLEAHAVVSLAEWHRASGRISDAVAAFDEGLLLAEEVVERELVCEALVGRAEIALLQENTATAQSLLARAQAEAQRLGAKTSVAAVDRAIGRLHLLDGSGQWAVDHLEQAVDRAGDAWAADQMAEALYWLGTAYLNLGRPQQAGNYLRRAAGIAEQANLPSLLARPAAEDIRLLQYGREVGINPVFLAEAERMAATRRPWTGVRNTPTVAVVAQNELPRLEVQLFGAFVLHLDGQLVGKVTRKVDRARELLALLILNPNGLADEAIAEMMFPDMGAQSGLHNLQMAAYKLRRDLGSGGRAAVRFGAGTYQLNPQLELQADVRTFDMALARARGTTGEQQLQALTRAVEAYRDPLLGDAGWQWLEPVRVDYRARYVSAALQLADVLARTDSARSDGLAESVLAIAPDTDTAYERLIHNSRDRKDALALRRLVARYEQAARQYGFRPIQYVTDRR